MLQPRQVGPEIPHICCSLGKSKIQGIRRPFPWTAPRFLSLDVDILGPLGDFLNHAASENPDIAFLLPDLRLSKTQGRGELDADAAWDFTKPMAHSKFLELSRSILLHANAPMDAATSYSYITFRRYNLLKQGGEPKEKGMNVRCWNPNV